MNEETVKSARDRYLSRNNMSLDSYTEKGFPIYFGKFTIHIPNPGLLHLHDLHHVVTGYETGFIGEAEVSAFELRAGCKHIKILALCIGAILIGFFISPKRILKAWKSAKHATALYRTKITYDALLEMKVVDLRKKLGIPSKGFKQLL